MEYSATASITFEDYCLFNSEHQKRALLRPKFLVPAIIVAALLLVAGTMDLIAVARGDKAFLGSFSYYLIFIAVFWLIFSRFGQKRRRRKIFESNQVIRETQNIEITEERIIQHSESGRLDIGRDKIDSIIFGKKGIYIFISKNQALIIPAHYFPGDQYAQVAAFIKAHFSSSQLK